jgi:hypothetical protein
MSHIVNMLNKRQETDVRRSKGVCDIFGQTLSQATSHHMTLSNMKAVYLTSLLVVDISHNKIGVRCKDLPLFEASDGEI